MSSNITGGFDLGREKEKTRAEDEGTVVHIRTAEGDLAYYTNGDGTEKPVTITVAGAHSRYYRRAEDEIRSRKIDRKGMKRQAAYDDEIFKAACCTLAWDGIVSDGVPVECTRSNATQVYKAFGWVYEDVYEAIHEPALFFKKSSQEPAST